MIDSQTKRPFEVLSESKEIFVSGDQKELVGEILTVARIPHFFDFLIKDSIEPFTVRAWVVVFSSNREARKAAEVLNAAPG